MRNPHIIMQKKGALKIKVDFITAHNSFLNKKTSMLTLVLRSQTKNSKTENGAVSF